MPATIYLVTGGARSGKSSYAQELCEQLSSTPIYLATAAASPSLQDEDFQQRIQKHQQDRQNNNKASWKTIEEPLKPSIHADTFKQQVVLVDCMTLWLTNWMMEEGAFALVVDDDDKKKKTDDKPEKDITAAVEKATKSLLVEFDNLTTPHYDRTFVFVTNEVGSGTHAATHISRKFVDAQGWCNQYVARKAQQVIHMVCGIPHILKNELLDDESHNATVMMDRRKLEAQRLDRHLSTRGLPMDAKGYFLVKTNVEESLIVVSFHSCIVNDKGEVCDLEGNKLKCHGKSPEPVKVWKGRTAKEITTEIFERWTDVDKYKLSVGHAAYIGREVQKAEFSLYQGGGKFMQD